MSSIPLETTTTSSTGTTPAGLTFIDNSDLSVCEKIKLYFAKNSKPIAYQSLISPTSSTSTLSPDLDASFKHMLEESRRRRNQTDQSRTADQRTAIMDFDESDLLVNDSTIDLCSSHESVEDLVVGSRPDVDVSPNLSAFNGTLFGAHDPRQRAASSRDLEGATGNGYESDDSLGVAELNDTLTEKDEDGQLPWYMERTDLDSSFLEHERECQREADEQERLANKGCADETQLFDTEAPSMLWDQTIVNDTLPMVPMRKTNAFRTRPSTIAEESTINSSVASSMASKTNNYGESSINVFPTKLADRSLAKGEAASRDRPIYKESSLSIFPEVDDAPKPFKAKAKYTPNYRESCMNVFPKKKFRTFYDQPGDLSVNSTTKPPIQSPIVPSKPVTLTPKPLLSASASLLNTRKQSPKPPTPTKPKPSPVALSPIRKSLTLMTFDDTICDENSFDDDANDSSSSSSLNTARHFNDTIEAMDFYMDRGQKLLQSAAKKTPPSKPTKPSASPKSVSPNLLHFSPKPSNRTTPDTIHRRLLMRNLLRNSDALADSGNNRSGSGPHQFSHAEMMLRRSIRRMDESFEN